ncbi:serine protease grass-like [Drosophila pseudoobscura]|uniref:Serine protease grass-like n=1 Tax=Drosophila pseudoobscura pseudoobscura TaxID=46245 RepID=A0A6I8UWN9_DROPS|nr:serine protease grass [Drosophila pseudoobscura]
MKIILAAVAVLACLILCHSGSGQFLQPDCGVVPNHFTFRIKGGTDAAIAANPWMAYLYTSSAFVCGGTLIHKRFVLTAAHCISREMPLKVRLGEFDVSSTSDCSDSQCLPPHEEYFVETAFRNRLFSMQRGRHDIGLLRLTTDVEYKVHIRPICVFVDPELRSSVEAIESFTATGWGVTDSGKTSRILQRITINRLDRSKCNRKFRQTLLQSQICAGHRQGDTCNGDSGGPLITFLNGTQNRYVQVGIVSYGSANCDGPGIYTDVLYHADWIQRVVREDEIKI